MEGLQYLSTSETLRRITPLIPCGILIDYLNTHKIAIDFDGSPSRERLSDLIEKSIRRAPKGTQAEVAAELDELNDHADVQFVEALIECGRNQPQPVSLDGVLSSMISHHARAMWTRVHHPNVYMSCLRFEQTEKIKYHVCRVPVRTEPIGPTELEALRKGLSQLSLSKGKGVVVDLFEMGTCHLFLCYVEGAPQRDLNFDKRSRLGHIDRRPALEVVYRYDPVNLTLRTRAEGGPNNTRQAQQLFGYVMFSTELPVALEEVRYNLNRFLKPGGCVLDVSGTPDVKSVTLTRIHLHSYDASLDASTYTFRRTATNEAIDGKLQELLASHGDDVQVDKVRLRFAFRNTTGRRSTFVNVDLTVDSGPHREDPRFETIVKLLNEWNIHDLTASTNDTVDTGTPAQCILRFS